MMAERRGRPGLATGIFVATLVVTALLSFCAVGVGALATSGANVEPAMIGFGVAAAAVLAGGSTVAVIVARRQPAGPSSGLTWQVAESGAHLRYYPGGTSVWLPPGTRVVETGKRRGGSIHVTAPDGQAGWLASVEVRPPEEPPPPSG
jgi:hypothetical protein